ncbi:cobalamin biosynthesis protein [Diaphorobacter aerolatus]|uniref:Cobalamin biosynthesis protein n=1 Tax=Diaphorobacter aerolatus TaxID=1288495 RepID=A0A7H0GJG0_9BURK|nr:cobalamin biosynthesis protein [Diaphorobacter aerolatus]QNP48426.1 cobalamin biosynthesis protein [Diaphorobacter aerolatus]
MKRVAGWGFRATATRQSFASCWARAMQSLGLHPVQQAQWLFAALDIKRDTVAMAEFNAWRAQAAPCASLVFYAGSEIRGIETPSRSLRLLGRFGTGSVAEALAAYGAGQRSFSCAPSEIRWLMPRVVSADGCATLAIATGISEPLRGILRISRIHLLKGFES